MAADVLPLRIRAEPAGSPLVVDARRLAAMLCCGIRSVRTWDAAGKLPAPVRIGGKVLWPVAEINDWIRAGCPDRETWEARRAARK